MITLDDSDLVSLDKFARIVCSYYRHTFIDLEPVSQKCFDVRSGSPDCRVSSPTPGSFHRLAYGAVSRKSLCFLKWNQIGYRHHAVLAAILDILSCRQRSRLHRRAVDKRVRINR
jgi:hypothetical protein